MKSGRFSEEQIVGVLKRHEAGQKVADLAREVGVSEATIYAWKSIAGPVQVAPGSRVSGNRANSDRSRSACPDC